MKMLLLVFRSSLDHDLQQLLKELGVKAFTEAPKVFGAGKPERRFTRSCGPAPIP
jgi:hypothetical protein